MNELIGQPVDRVDGRLKVTGKAPYSAEFPLKNLAYGVTTNHVLGLEIVLPDGSVAKLGSPAEELCGYDLL